MQLVLLQSLSGLLLFLFLFFSAFLLFLLFIIENHVRTTIILPLIIIATLIFIIFRSSPILFLRRFSLFDLALGDVDEPPLLFDSLSGRENNFIPSVKVGVFNEVEIYVQ